MLPPWRVKGYDKPLFELPIEVYGFVYLLEYNDGTRYIGKKKVYREAVLKPLKNGNKRPSHLNYFYKGKGNKLERIATQSNWKAYTGSSELTPPVSELKSRTIIAFSRNKQTMTYLETKWMFASDAIVKPEYHNAHMQPLPVYDNAMSGKMDISEVIGLLEKK